MTPYTYLVTHLATGKRYYGVRTAKGCTPVELGVTYFTSSRILKSLILLEGCDAFTFEVRKIFQSPLDALVWEHKVLRRIDAAISPMWFNRHNGNRSWRCWSHSEQTRMKLSKALKGRPKSVEWKQKASEAALKDRQRRRDNGWKMPREAVERMAETHRGVPRSPEMVEKMRASKTGTKKVWMPDGTFRYLRPQQDQ